MALHRARARRVRAGQRTAQSRARSHRRSAGAMRRKRKCSSSSQARATLLLVRAGREKISVVQLDARAVRALQENLAARSIANVSARECPAEVAAATHRSSDIIVLDPPRQGASEVIAALVTDLPRRLVYVGASPRRFLETQRLIAAGDALDSLDAFEMFPQTPHVELVAVFSQAAQGQGEAPPRRSSVAAERPALSTRAPRVRLRRRLRALRVLRSRERPVRASLPQREPSSVSVRTGRRSSGDVLQGVRARRRAARGPRRGARVCARTARGSRRRANACSWRAAAARRASE